MGAPGVTDAGGEDPCPMLVVERGPRNEGVGTWVPNEKHRFLKEYLSATRHAWAKWPRRVFIDPFAGPGRIQVKGESITRDGGAVVAWQALKDTAPFTGMFVGDIEEERASACEQRLKALGAPAQKFVGAAEETVPRMIAQIPKNSLCIAYIDPYNLELLTFSIIEQLASVSKIDLAVNFSTMDLQRNVELEFDPRRARFDGTAPGWRDSASIKSSNRENVKLAFFNYWCDLVRKLGFNHSREMPLVRNDHGHPIYRMVFFARHDLPTRIWNDVARSRNRSFDF